MMVEIKRFKLLVLICVTLWIVLPGCSAGSKPIGSAEEGAVDSEGLYEIAMVFPMSAEPKDLLAIQEAVNTITRAKIQAAVKLIPISYGAWSQQTMLMFAGQQKIDLVVTGLGDYSQQVAKEQLLELDAYLAQQGQGITKALDGLDPAFLNATRINGHIYGVPTIRDLASDYGILMRKDLVDKYKIDTAAIRSLNDLDLVFQMIKDNEPGIIPTVKYRNSIIDMYLGGYFDSLGDSYGVLPGYDNDLKIVNMFETSEYAELLHTVRSWYLAGYIDKDAAISTESQYNLVRTGKAFSFISHMKPGIENQESRIMGTEMVAVHLRPAVITTYNITSIMWSIASKSERPDKAMQLLNLLYTDKELINLLDYGIEGTHYMKLPDNTIDFPEGVSASNSGYNMQLGWLFGNQFLSYIWNGDDPALWDKLASFNKHAMKSKALGFTFNTEAVKAEIAAVTNVSNQYRVALETGTIDPEKRLPDFIDALKTAGIDIIIAEKQRQLDAWAAMSK